MPAHISDVLKDRYRLEALLKTGEIGASYYALDIPLKKPCIIKEFRSEYLPSMHAARFHEGEDGTLHREKKKQRVVAREKAVEQFMQEARLLLKLEHPSLPKVTDYFNEGENYYLVMVLVEGHNLAEMLADRAGEPFSEQQVLEWMGQVMDAVAYCHARGVIHRDIKPANVIIDSTGKAYLVDFGITKPFVTSGKISGKSAKITGYTPPEKYGQNAKDFPGDIYSLGATLYALLTAREPINVDERKMGMELPSPRQINSSISPSTDVVIQRAMSIHLRDRFQSVEEMKTALMWTDGGSKAGEKEIAAPIETAGGVQNKTLLPAMAQGENLVHDQAKDVKPGEQKPGSAECLSSPHTPLQAKPKGAHWIKSLLNLPSPSSPRIKKSFTVIGIILLVCIVLVGLNRTLPGMIVNSINTRKTSIVLALEVLQANQTLAAAPTSTDTLTLTYTPTLTLTTTPTETPSSTVTPSPTLTSTPTVTPSLTLTPTVTLTPTITPTPHLGSTQLSTVDKMVMVYVPQGDFSMGSDNGEANAQPMHQVWLDAFWIDRTEITNAKYAMCVQEGGCSLPRHDDTSGWGAYYGNPKFDDFPVVYVSWKDAVAYCSWAGRRVPSEAEWEKGARGTDRRTYPWGNTYNSKYSNSGQTHFATMQVGSFSEYPSPYGAFDMAGNVWEWVMDWYGGYPKILPTKTNPTGPNSGKDHIARGGSWSSVGNYYIKTYARSNQSGNSTSELIGFRCAESLIP